MFRKRKKVNLVKELLQQDRSISIRDRSAALDYLVAFVDMMRPRLSEFENVQKKFAETIQFVHQYPSVLNNLRTAIMAQLINSNLVPMFTESGITISRGAGRELFARLKHKFLPAARDPNDFLYLLNRIFFKQTDYEWVEKIGRDKWMRFFDGIGLSFSGSDPVIIKQAVLSLQILSARVAQLGWEKEITHNTPEQWQPPNNPFAVQQHLVYQIKERILREHQGPESIQDLARQLSGVLAECEELVQLIRDETEEKGTSLSQTFTLFQLEQKLNRMTLLLDIAEAEEKINLTRFAQMFITVVRYENRKNSIREFLSQTTGYLAYQIAEHKGKKGSKYITASPLEYFQMIGSAMWGGLIICFVAIFKNLLGMLHMAPFWHGFVYSVNYSLGFVAIEETGATLATKQPAFTASAVASSLDARKTDDPPNLYNLAVTVSKVSRSQIASFIGNLIVVFPGTYLLAWLYDLAIGHPLVQGEKAAHLLQDQHPWQSLSLLYACNTGFFLFLSGIIAGYVENKINYGRIDKRLTEHPVLRVSLPPSRLQKLAAYLNSHGGSLAGNISLGFFLGMAGIVGKIFGIPFDIRHITISAANTSLGAYGVGWEHMNYRYLANVVMGVLGIGFLNFLVSFSLAFFVAVRSRDIHLKDYPGFLKILWKYFRSHPLDFIRPRKRRSETEKTETA
ncbi:MULTISPECIES: site-specific recombinase [Niastella]|uniref:Site-specific recombinase n=1 Tax=Niastella soli TaxID=2821487 RepID=A0ABS3YUT0_9BACT|nr:site-specific recombinase [Niastella soli]MBO9201645.1 site-specific recombinase [Niastella soli]